MRLIYSVLFQLFFAIKLFAQEDSLIVTDCNNDRILDTIHFNSCCGDFKISPNKQFQDYRIEWVGGTINSFPIPPVLLKSSNAGCKKLIEDLWFFSPVRSQICIGEIWLSEIRKNQHPNSTSSAFKLSFIDSSKYVLDKYLLSVVAFKKCVAEEYFRHPFVTDSMWRVTFNQSFRYSKEIRIDSTTSILHLEREVLLKRGNSYAVLFLGELVPVEKMRWQHIDTVFVENEYVLISQEFLHRITVVDYKRGLLKSWIYEGLSYHPGEKIYIRGDEIIVESQDGTLVKKKIEFDSKPIR
ncbi:MAG: hypothetical protein ACO3EE_02855 [Flavobacteriales bacterium]